MFATEAPRRVWSAASVNDAPPPVVASSSREHTLSNASGYVCVLDETTGNLAVRPARGLKTWQVLDGDYLLIGRVEAGAEPPPATAGYTCQGQSFLVSPDGAKQATFYGLKPGSLEIGVTFVRNGENTTKKQTFEIKLKRSDPVPHLIVGVGPAVPQQTPPKAPPRGKVLESGNILGTLLAILIVAAFAVAVLIFGMKWIYANQDKAQSALGKLGVQVPDTLDPAPDPVAPPSNPIPDPAPMAPIVLPGASPVVGAIQGGAPRLTGAVGSYELSDGVHVLGREAGLTISLVGETTLSRRHAEFVVNGGQITLRDLGSTNGTFVNGHPVTDDILLRVGDSVRFGSVQFRVEG